MLVNIKKWKYEGTDDCGSTAVTDDLFMHSSLPPTAKHIQVIKLNYKKRWNLHKNSQAVKKVWPMQKMTAWKKLWNQRWQPRSGCDGGIMSKFLITTIQVNLVPIPIVKLGGGNTNFPGLLLLKILPLSYHHSHFWAATFDFTTFFMLSFFAWVAPFFTVCRGDYNFSKVIWQVSD